VVKGQGPAVFLSFIKIHVLHHAAEEEVSGLALIAELRLGEAGYLRRIDRIVNWKVGKDYGGPRLLLVALYHPVWTSAIKTSADLALSLVAFALLAL